MGILVINIRYVNFRLIASVWCGLTSVLTRALTMKLAIPSVQVRCLAGARITLVDEVEGMVLTEWPIRD